MVELMGLFLHEAVDCDASVGADCGACRTSDALVGIFVGDKVIATVIHFLRLESEDVARASYDTEVATFTSFSVNFNSANNFCHILLFTVSS